MDTAMNPMFLSQDEVLFHHMETFHRQRVEAIVAGQSPIGKRDDGVLIVHLLSKTCFASRIRLDTAKLKEIGSQIPSLGEGGSYFRFNTDGFLHYDEYKRVRSYSLLFRSGHLEGVMTEVKHQLGRDQENSLFVLRDSICEKAVLNTVKVFLNATEPLGLEYPIWMFSALIGCEGAYICTNWSCHDLSKHSVDRPVCFLPELEIASNNEQLDKLLKPWCDTLWQACGMERSFNFDNDGNWRDRRR